MFYQILARATPKTGIRSDSSGKICFTRYFHVKAEQMKEKVTHCTECHSEAEFFRKGLCDKCYQRQYHGRTIGDECECCGYSDTRTLVRRRLDGATWTTLCANCAQIRGRRPLNLDELREDVFPDTDRRGANLRSGSRRGQQRRRIDIGSEDDMDKRRAERRLSSLLF